MKANKLALVAGFGLVTGSLIHIANFQTRRELQAGIGGTWSADMKVQPTVFKESEREEALVELIKSGSLSDDQRSALQSQYLAAAILKKSAQYGVVDQRSLSDVVVEAIQKGVLSSGIGM